MVGVFVTFQYKEDFDAKAVRTIAEAARPMFEGLPGLRAKAFTLNPAKRQATNFYLWDSEDAARAFFSEELLAQVTGLYGVRPTVDFVEIAAVVENMPAMKQEAPGASP